MPLSTGLFTFPHQAGEVMEESAERHGIEPCVKRKSRLEGPLRLIQTGAVASMGLVRTPVFIHFMDFCSVKEHKV